MEVEKISSTITSCKDEGDDPLPGFRFHPTDEELVWFYLRRKIENRPFGIELIKEIDIYKHDPWDLPKASNVGDKECYFFCKRGRKYRNSIRPNRVTGSGFWKATGIDRSIYSAGGEGRECIGLKKSLVYYRGSAGKGTKTDWMMHEFRLPGPTDYDKAIKHIEAKSNIPQEAEVWTLCKIVKRNAYKKCIPDWKDISTKKVNSNNMIQTDHSSSKTSCSTMESGNRQSYISFNSSSSPVIQQNMKKPCVSYNYGNVDHATNQLFLEQLRQTEETMAQVLVPSTTTSSASYSSFWSPETTGDWNDLKSIVEYGANDPFFLM